MNNSYHISDICSLVKGESPIMKTEPGKYPLVVTAEYRRSASTYQLEGPAVCVPLISSTGHGDAALHRVHYQEGKFALANLLVALIPKDPTICNAKYLYHLLMAKKNEYLVPLMLGTANVSLKVQDVAGVRIQLPTLHEQRRIVARIEELSAKIEEARGLRQHVGADMEGLVASELHQRFVIEENRWHRSTVGDAADIIDPNPSHRMPGYAEIGIPFISTVDFVDSEGIRRRTAKHVTEETYLQQRERCSFAVGDILYSRIGTIGAARLIAEVWPFALSHVLVIVKPKKGIVPRFLLWYLRSDSIVSQASEATRSVGVPDLGIKRIRSFHMPIPPITEQLQMVTYLDNLQAKVDTVKTLQEETVKELDVFMPSIFSRAFSGEL